MLVSQNLSRNTQSRYLICRNLNSECRPQKCQSATPDLSCLPSENLLKYALSKNVQPRCSHSPICSGWPFGLGGRRTWAMGMQWHGHIVVLIMIVVSHVHQYPATGLYSCLLLLCLLPGAVAGCYRYKTPSPSIEA